MSAIAVNYDQAESMVTNYLKASLVPMITGSPGVGKSALALAVAEKYNLKLIDLRLSQCDPTDLLGIPSINRERGRAEYLPLDTFPLEGDAIPEGYSGWLLFLDEFNSADRPVQKAAYKLVNEGVVGMYPLHQNVAMMCAGNLDTDNAIVEEMSTALQSRLVHLELTLDHKVWLNWAQSKEIDHRICSFIEFKPQSLFTFSPDHSDRTYACPRTWEFAHRVLETIDDDYPHTLPMLSGCISEGVAREFTSFTRIYKDLPTVEQLLTKGDKLPVPDEPSVLFALVGSIAHNADKDNIDDLMKFAKRLPPEFQVVCLRQIIKRRPELERTKAVSLWVTQNSSANF